MTTKRKKPTLVSELLSPQESKILPKEQNCKLTSHELKPETWVIAKAEESWVK